MTIETILAQLIGFGPWGVTAVVVLLALSKVLELLKALGEKGYRVKVDFGPEAKGK